MITDLETLSLFYSFLPVARRRTYQLISLFLVVMKQKLTEKGPNRHLKARNIRNPPPQKAAHRVYKRLLADYPIVLNSQASCLSA